MALALGVSDRQLPQCNYLIGVCILPDGLGDAASALKVANFIHERGVPKENIYFASDDARKAALFNKYEFSLLDFEEVQETKKTHKFGIQILVSVCLLADVAHCVTNEIPSLLLYEYGNTNIPLPEAFQELMLTKSMGLNASLDEIGILIDPKLKEWGFSEEAKDPLKRIQKLDQATASLKKAILGESLDAQMFIEDNLLYLAYPKSGEFSKSFAAAIAKLNVDNQKNIVLFFPGGHLASRFKDAKWADSLFSSGISTITFDYYDKVTGDIKTQTLHQNPGAENNKSLRIITGHVNHKDMHCLWMASEREVVICGDGSLDEACSTNKAAFFEVRDHKTKVADILKKLYRQTKEGYVVEGNSIGNRTGRLTCETIEREMSLFFEANRDYQDITSFNRNICDNFDCTDRILSLIQQVMSKPRVAITRLQDKTVTDWNEALPNDSIATVSLNQVQHLEINIDSGLSAREELTNSFFSTYSLFNGTYLIKKTRQ